MAKLLDKFFGFLPWAFNALFGALGIHDKQKKAIIILLAWALITTPFATLQVINIWQKVKYQKDNPNRFPMSAPAVK